MESTPTSIALAQIEQLFDRAGSDARVRLSDHDRLDLVTQAKRVARRAEALLGVLVAEADAANSAKNATGVPTTSWLALSGDLSSKEAAGLVFTGRDLNASQQTRDAALAARPHRHCHHSLPDSHGRHERARSAQPGRADRPVD